MFSYKQLCAYVGHRTSPRCRELHFIGSTSQSLRDAMSSATSHPPSATSHTTMSVYGVGGVADPGLYDLSN